MPDENVNQAPDAHEQDHDPTIEEMFGPAFADDEDGDQEQVDSQDHPEDSTEPATEAPAEDDGNADAAESEPQQPAQEQPRKLGTWNGIEFTTEHVPPGMDEHAFVALLTQANQAVNYQRLYEQAAGVGQGAQAAAQQQGQPQQPQPQAPPSGADAIKADIETYVPIVEQIAKELPEDTGISAFLEDFPGAAAIMAKHEAMIGALMQSVQPVVMEAHQQKVQQQFFNVIENTVPEPEREDLSDFLNYLAESDLMQTAPPEVVFDPRFPSMVQLHWNAYKASKAGGPAEVKQHQRSVDTPEAAQPPGASRRQRSGKPAEDEDILEVFGATFG